MRQFDLREFQLAAGEESLDLLKSTTDNRLCVLHCFGDDRFDSLHLCFGSRERVAELAACQGIDRAESGTPKGFISFQCSSDNALDAAALLVDRAFDVFPRRRSIGFHILPGSSDIRLDRFKCLSCSSINTFPCGRQAAFYAFPCGTSCGFDPVPGIAEKASDTAEHGLSRALDSIPQTFEKSFDPVPDCLRNRFDAIPQP